MISSQMNEFSEDQIWDAIMESAKSKVDYDAFAGLFTFNPDNFLSSIIYGFATGKGPGSIADKISTQVYMTRNFVDKAALTAFIDQAGPLLHQEIALTIRALNMLNDGEEPETVYQTVSEALHQQ